MHNFKKLNIWKDSIELTKLIYKNTDKFPKSEIYGLTSQLRRSVISVPSNIAEGSGRNSDKEFRKHLNIAIGSLFELETQVIIAHELNLLTDDNFNTLDSKISDLQKMTIGFKNKFIE